MKKFFSLILLALLPMFSFAEEAEINGLWYNLMSKQAKVINSKSSEYSGDIEIPVTVEYGGATYNVTSIGDRAFIYCRNLTSITIPEGVTWIGKQAFIGCSSLTSVTIPNSVTSIGEGVFRYCSGLISVTIGNSVTSIGRETFYSCSSLTSITIPEGVTSIGGEAFRGCSSLTSIKVAEGNTVYDSRDNCNAIINTATNTLIVGCMNTIIPEGVTSISSYAFSGCSSLTSITIPEGVTRIGEDAFSGCSSLTSITIPSSVTSISGWAFSGCSSLTSITIPSSMTVISSNAFSGCSSLTSITIPEGVTNIGEDAFSGCSSLISITIPSSMTYIGKSAFSRCSSLTEVYCYAESIPRTYGNPFYNSGISTATLHVPAESIDCYKATEPWSLFGTIVTLDGYTPEPPEPKKCATPTISYTGGKLILTSATEEAECVSVISDPDIKTHYGNEISLTATYNLTIYATKADFENSDTIQATLCWIDAEPRTEGLQEDAVAEVKALPVLIQSQGGIITIQGVDSGIEFFVYSTDGKKEGSAISVGNQAVINTNLASGSIAIVKIGEKSIKVKIR